MNPLRKNRAAVSRKRFRDKNPDYWKIHRAEKLMEDPDYLKRGRRLRKKRNPQRYLWRSAKTRARQKNLEFTITPEDIHIPKFCPVLGIPLIMSESGKASDNSPSVERLVLSKGYIPGNIAVISWRANSLRKDATLTELKLMVKFYAKHLR